MKKAKDFVSDWIDKNCGGCGGKELGNWTTCEVMKFANDFAEHRLKSVEEDDVISQLKHVRAFLAVETIYEEKDIYAKNLLKEISNYLAKVKRRKTFKKE